MFWDDAEDGLSTGSDVEQRMEKYLAARRERRGQGLKCDESDVDIE